MLTAMLCKYVPPYTGTGHYHSQRASSAATRAPRKGLTAHMPGCLRTVVLMATCAYALPLKLSYDFWSLQRHASGEQMTCWMQVQVAASKVDCTMLF